MKHFYIIVNEDKEDTKAMGARITRYLEDHGCTFRTSKGVFSKGKRFTSVSDVPEDTECVITLGGDGTFIQAARDLAGTGLPIVGINLGDLGYLTQMGKGGNLEELLDALLSDRYEIQERMMLTGRIYHKGRPEASHIALNDIVLAREGDMRVVRSDGVIVSTPTGSTAYNLSAGGPIAQPDGELLILTPVCPHTLTSRTIVLGPESRIRIEISEKNEGCQAAAFDGGTKVALTHGDYIEIERSKMVTRAVKLDDRSFLDILKHKMYDA